MSDITLRAKVGTGPKPLRNAMLMYYRRHALAIKIGALVLFLVVAGWPWVVVTVPAGYVAVKYIASPVGPTPRRATAKAAI